MPTYKKSNGSVTVTNKKGKIVGNIGQGKVNVPTTGMNKEKTSDLTVKKTNLRIGDSGSHEMLLEVFAVEETEDKIKDFSDSPGTKIFEKITLNANPNMDAEKLTESLYTLYNEAYDSGMDEVVIPESTVYAWIDAQRFMAITEFENSVNKQNLLTELDKIADEYSQDSHTITPSMIHAWKYAESVTQMAQKRQPHSNPQSIAVDLDGVLYEVETVMHKWLVNQGYTPPAHEIRTYDMATNWGLTGKIIGEEFGKAVDAGLMFRYGDVYPEGLASVKKIYESGHKIVIITARDLPDREKKCHQATLKWLREKNIPFDSLHLTRDKEKIHFDLLVDDAPDNVEKVMGWGKRGVILHRQWNKDEGDGYERKTWIDVMNELSQNDEGTLFSTGKIVFSDVAQTGTIKPGEGGDQARNKKITTA